MQTCRENGLATSPRASQAWPVKAATLLSTIALAASLAAVGMSAHAVRVARQTEALRVPPSARVGAEWTAADESAVAVLTTKTGQQLGGYLASLKRGTARHQWTERQIEEAIRRQRAAVDWAQ